MVPSSSETTGAIFIKTRIDLRGIGSQGKAQLRKGVSTIFSTCCSSTRPMVPYPSQLGDDGSDFEDLKEYREHIKNCDSVKEALVVLITPRCLGLLMLMLSLNYHQMFLMAAKTRRFLT
ncbi:hypothetical protein F4819DRAFT_481744 [Hypoxylon fuscum]|nr:hypothetical protein F4819DRAFT_481744 [Hypoxylon fuscum]